MAWSSCAGFSNGSIWKTWKFNWVGCEVTIISIRPFSSPTERAMLQRGWDRWHLDWSASEEPTKKKLKRKINGFEGKLIFGSSKPSHPLCSWTFEDSSWSCLEWWLHWKSSISRLFKMFCFLPVVQWSVRDVVLIQGRSQNVQHVWKIICREKRMFPTQLRKKSESLGISKENFHLSKLRRPGSWLHYLHFWSWSKTSPPPPP